MAESIEGISFAEDAGVEGIFVDEVCICAVTESHKGVPFAVWENVVSFIGLFCKRDL